MDQPIEATDNANQPAPPGKRERRWLTRTVLGIGLASLFSDMSHETVTAVLPAYLASMGAAAGVLGTIEGVADGLSSAAKLSGGHLADRLFRRKPLCAAGYGFMAVATLIIAAATRWPIVLGGRAFAWISRGLRTPARKALLAEAVTPQSYGRAFGFERAMDTVGAIIAPLAALALLGIGLSHRQVILLSVIPALLAVFAIVFLVRETPGREPINRPFIHSFRGFSPAFKEFLGAVGLFGIGDFADTFYILYAVMVLAPEIGAAQAAAWSVALYALHNVFYASWSYAGGWIADRVNKRMLLAIGYTCAGLAALCIVLGMKSSLGLAVMFALGGSAVGLYEAVEDAVTAELLPAQIRGSGFGVLSVMTGLGDLLSSVVVGWLWAGFGTKIAFGYAMILMIAGALFMLHLATRRTTSTRTPT